MRDKLKQINDDRKTFKGTFKRFGKKPRYKPKRIGDAWIDFDTTVLLTDIRDDMGKPVCDHLWLNYTKGFEALGELKEGDEVIFDARVKPYLKGYVNDREYVDDREIDYKLSHPTKVKKSGDVRVGWKPMTLGVSS